MTQTSPLHAIRLRPRGLPNLLPRGLPQRLPEGEALLWQGSPRATTLMRRAFHIGMVAAYFALIVALVRGHRCQPRRRCPRHRCINPAPRGAGRRAAGADWRCNSWAIQRSTIYTITTRRVVISFGIALPVSFNIPFTKIAAANLRQYPGGAGDIALQLLPTEQMSYMVMWPHARPWRMARTEPMLRGIPGALEACEILSKALAEDAQQPHTAPTAGQQARPARPAPNSARRPAQPAVA